MNVVIENDINEVNLMKGKTIFILILSVLFIFGSSANDDSSDKSNNENDENIVLTLGHEFPQDHLIHKNAVEYAESVKNESKGKVEIEILPQGQMGSATEMIAQIQSGDLDMSVNSGPSHEPLLP